MVETDEDGIFGGFQDKIQDTDQKSSPNCVSCVSCPEMFTPKKGEIICVDCQSVICPQNEQIQVYDNVTANDRLAVDFEDVSTTVDGEVEANEEAAEVVSDSVAKALFPGDDIPSEEVSQEEEELEDSSVKTDSVEERDDLEAADQMVVDHNNGAVSMDFTLKRTDEDNQNPLHADADHSDDDETLPSVVSRPLPLSGCSCPDEHCEAKLLQVECSGSHWNCNNMALGCLKVFSPKCAAKVGYRRVSCRLCSFDGCQCELCFRNEERGDLHALPSPNDEFKCRNHIYGCPSHFALNCWTADLVCATCRYVGMEVHLELMSECTVFKPAMTSKHSGICVRVLARPSRPGSSKMTSDYFPAWACKLVSF
jgi:hypothetical protein